MGKITVKTKSIGDPLQKSEIKEQMSFGVEFTSEENIIISNLISKTIGNDVRLKSSRGINRSYIDVSKIKSNSLAVIFGALILGLIVGAGLKFFAPEIAVAASEYAFTPIYTMFLNALKMIVGPLVFITIANSVMEFDDISVLGKIAGKTFFTFVCTSLLAIGVGIVTFRLFPIGNPALQSAITDEAQSTIETAAESDTSILHMIVNIVPTDVITPFMEMDMLQVVFMAILLGVAVALVGKGTIVYRFISDANTIMLKITGIIIAFLPLSAFCSLANLVICTDAVNLMDAFAWVPVNCIGHLLMFVVYAALLIVFVRMNPIKFLKEFYPAIVTAFATSSSNATMPVSMDRCGKALKISPKVYAFTIPFGATVNMDGNCITLVITTLYMANIFNVSITTGMMLSLVFTMLALTIGSPGIPGGNIVNMTIILPMIGVPAEAVSLVIGMYCIIGMTQTIDNVTGDAVVSVMVAKSENLIDAD